MYKKISVIIPCYCASKWLSKCYSSLINQTIGIDSIQLIFIDDASDDNERTWNMLLSFEQNFPDSIIIIRSEENRRQGGVRNMALPYATGEYILFCDADDWLDETALEKTYACAKKYDADIVQFQHYYYIDKDHIRPESNNEKDLFIEINSMQERKYFINSEVMGLGCCYKLYRRDFILHSGVLFAEHVVYEEPLFTYPLLYTVKRFAQIKDHLYYYRYNENGTMMSYMNNMKTLTDHMSVQIQLHELMSRKSYFTDYKDEIELHFVHSYLYETILFAKLRNFPGAYTIFQHLGFTIRNFYPDLVKNSYLQIESCKKQKQILELAMDNASEEEFCNFYNNLS